LAARTLTGVSTGTPVADDFTLEVRVAGSTGSGDFVVVAGDETGDRLTGAWPDVDGRGLGAPTEPEQPASTTPAATIPASTIILGRRCSPTDIPAPQLSSCGLARITTILDGTK